MWNNGPVKYYNHVEPFLTLDSLETIIPNLTVEENQKPEKPYTTGVLRLLLSKDMLYGVLCSEIFFDDLIQFFWLIVKAVQCHSC